MKRRLLVLLTVIALIIGLSCVSLTAYADVLDMSPVEGTDYIKEEIPAGKLKTSLQKQNFDVTELGTLVASQWGNRGIETENPISGSGSIWMSSSEAGYAQTNWAIMTAKREAGRYYIEFDMLPVKGVSGMAINIFREYYVGSADYCLVGMGLAFTWDNGSLANVEISSAGGGWKHAGFDAASVEKNDNGSYHVYFEYAISESDVALLTDERDPHIWFCANASDATDNKIIVDNVDFGSVATTDAVTRYYTVDWDESYESYEVGSNAAGSQPIWGNSASIVDDWFETKALALGGVNGANVPIGGFEGRSDEAHIGYKFIKNAGKNYIEIVIDKENCSMINIWTSGWYTAVMFNGESWHSEGAVSGFQAVTLEQGWKLSYCIDLPVENYNIDFNINASGNNGTVYIDSLKVVSEDYAPYVAGGSYNLIDTQNVEVKAELKGKAFSSLTINGEAVDSTLYALADGNLTLNKDIFSEEADSYRFTLTSEGGSEEFVIVKNDNRQIVTVSAGEIRKVYDGTTDVAAIELILGGVDDEHQVAVSYESASYDVASVNATKVIFNGIAISGDDAYRYILSSDVLEASASITKKSATVVAEAKEKVEGDSDPELTYTVEGLIDEDVLSGALSRVEGDEVGEYAILIGTLGNENYEIEYTGAKLTVTARPSSGEEGSGSNPEIGGEGSGSNPEIGGEGSGSNGSSSSDNNNGGNNAGNNNSGNGGSGSVEPDGGLSTGAIVGIVIAVIAVVAIAGAAVIVIIKKKQSK